MKYRTPFVAFVLAALMLAGCAGQEAVKSESADGAKTSSADSKQAGMTASQLSEQERLRAQRNAYFAFDSTSIDADTRALIKAHAQHLVAQPKTAVALDGYCDERGTREYNLRLGEQRAQAVAKLMQAMGVASNRITTNSYGKEKPVCSEHDEACWQKNRRVEIVYR